MGPSAIPQGGRKQQQQAAHVVEELCSFLVYELQALAVYKSPIRRTVGSSSDSSPMLAPKDEPHTISEDDLLLPFAAAAGRGGGARVLEPRSLLAHSPRTGHSQPAPLLGRLASLPTPHRLDKVTTTRAMTECLPRPINQDTLPLPTLQRFHQQRHPLHRGQKPSPSPKTSCVSGSAAKMASLYQSQLRSISHASCQLVA